MDSHQPHLIILAVLLSVVGPIRGAERELLLPILAHVENYRSTMFMLNPEERVQGETVIAVGVLWFSPETEWLSSVIVTAEPLD